MSYEAFKLNLKAISELLRQYDLLTEKEETIKDKQIQHELQNLKNQILKMCKKNKGLLKDV